MKSSDAEISSPKYLFFKTKSLTDSEPNCLPAKITTHRGSSLEETHASHINRLIGSREDLFALN